MSFYQTADGMTIDKDPDDILDYVIDLSAWMPSDDFIVSIDAEVEVGDVEVSSATVNAAPITVEEEQGARSIEARKAAVLWISGGSLNTVSRVRTRFNTNSGRRRDVSFNVRLLSR